MLKLIHNTFNDKREIAGFDKDEMLEIKKTLVKIKSEGSAPEEVDEYLYSLFPSEVILGYTNYIHEIKNFIEKYLIISDDLETNKYINYSSLKSGILNELKLISNNIINLKSNCRNAKRFFKDNSYLDEFLSTIKNIANENDELIEKLEKSIQDVEGLYDNLGYIWIEANKIKNLMYKINEISSDLKNWDEIEQLHNFIEELNIDKKKKKIKKKGVVILTSYFNEIYRFFSKKDKNIDFYSDFIFLLFQNNIIDEIGEEDDIESEFVNVLERKEIVQKLEKILRPLINSLIITKLNKILVEIKVLDKNYGLEPEKKNLNIKTLFEQKFGAYLPKLSDYYLNGLEMKYQETLSELNYDEFKNVRKLYAEKTELFYSLIEIILEYINEFDWCLTPYYETTDSYKKIIENVLSELTRRREEYLFYLKSIRKERIRDNVRNYIYDKIGEVNDLMNKYQDETALLVREEFPQLKQMREIISEYKVNVQKVKDEVYKKLDFYKEKHIDIYQIIKQWEDNFTLKRQQLSFLLSMVLKKLFKSFKEIIEEEDIVFDHISEIAEESATEVPLNFALTNFLLDKLSEDELNERIAEVKHKIENLSNELDLYRSELTNFEISLSDRVKIREGITSDKIRCGVCHKNFDFAKEQIIKCPFCEAVFHYLCVAFWLTKYNACPACQNTFLDPGSGMYEDQE